MFSGYLGGMKIWEGGTYAGCAGFMGEVQFARSAGVEVVGDDAVDFRSEGLDCD